jgi:hypothetical protein
MKVKYCFSGQYYSKIHECIKAGDKYIPVKGLKRKFSQSGGTPQSPKTPQPPPVYLRKAWKKTGCSDDVDVKPGELLEQSEVDDDGWIQYRNEKDVKYKAQLKYYMSPPLPPGSTCQVNPTYKNERMREIAIEWMIDVVTDFELMDTNTLFDAVNIFDLYLSKNQDVSRKYLQLIATAALMLASKFNSAITKVPLIEYAYLTGDSYTVEQIRDAELKMVRKLGYELRYPTTKEIAYEICTKCGFAPHHVDKLLIMLLYSYKNLVMKYTQAEIASAAVKYIHGAHKIQLQNYLYSVIQVNKENVETCVNYIQSIRFKESVIIPKDESISLKKH